LGRYGLLKKQQNWYKKPGQAFKKQTNIKSANQSNLEYGLQVLRLYDVIMYNHIRSLLYRLVVWLSSWNGGRKWRGRKFT